MTSVKRFSPTLRSTVSARGWSTVARRGEYEVATTGERGHLSPVSMDRRPAVRIDEGAAGLPPAGLPAIAARDHWAYQPPRRPPLPSSLCRAGGQGPSPTRPTSRRSLSSHLRMLPAEGIVEPFTMLPGTAGPRAGVAGCRR